MTRDQLVAILTGAQLRRRVVRARTLASAGVRCRRCGSLDLHAGGRCKAPKWVRS